MGRKSVHLCPMLMPQVMHTVMRMLASPRSESYEFGRRSDKTVPRAPHVKGTQHKRWQAIQLNYRDALEHFHSFAEDKQARLRPLSFVRIFLRLADESTAKSVNSLANSVTHRTRAVQRAWLCS